MKLPVLVVLGGLLLAIPAGAAPPGASCLPWRAAVLSTKQADTRNALVNIMEGEEASNFLSFANALPPASHIDGDKIAVLFAPQDDRFIFVVGRQNCATAIMQVPRAAMEQLSGRSV